MPRYPLALVAVGALFLLASAARPAAARTAGPAAARPLVAGGEDILVSAGSSLAARSAAATDTFWLFGGPGTLEGKFETASGQPDMQGWTGVDHTMQISQWRVSGFHADNLGGHGAGNLAAWAGRTAAEEPGWATAPGYGNNWDSSLQWESAPVANPAAGQVVSLDFYFNLDSEPDYDFLAVEYEKAGSWVTVYQGSGHTGDSAGVFLPPGARFSDLQQGPIVYDGGDYAGPQGDRIRIRVRVTSDGAWSDQDGIWDTDGHTQLDDILVSWSGGSSFHDFEDGGFGDWAPFIPDFAGNFAKVFFRMGDIDPCAENRTPFVAFIDDGRPVGNSAEAILKYGTDTTGGTTSPTWSYGVAGGWVTNYNGGLSGGTVALHNSVWSPAIDWDLPGPEDDGPAVSGAILRFDVYNHLSQYYGIFYEWTVRNRVGGEWLEWENYAFIEAALPGVWDRRNINVTPFVRPGRDAMQIQVTVIDLADLFAFPGGDATPSPAFDNFSLVKYEIGGPAISTRTIDLFHDAFPASGLVDASDDAARGQLDIRVDMARDISTGPMLITGDSIIVDVRPVIPGSSVDMADIAMEWVLDLNPHFANARVQPPGAALIPGGAVNGWDQWRGSVAADSSTTSTGAKIAERYFFDLPDADFFHPGDVLRYYVRATDDAGRTSTLPANITGFDIGWANGQTYDRYFTVHGLPSIIDDGFGGIHQPDVLVIDEGGELDNPDRLQRILVEAGLAPSGQLAADIYRVTGARSAVSNGIGSAAGHGATTIQLAGYSCLVYFCEEHGETSLSDGSDSGDNDKSDDIGRLDTWFSTPGPRFAAFFGNGLASQLATSPAGSSFLADRLGVELVGPDVAPAFGGQLNPLVAPASPIFGGDYVAYGGCPGLPWFDHIRPLPAASQGHDFLDGQGSPIAGAAASVVRSWSEGGDTRIAVTFPYGLGAPRHDLNSPGSPPALTKGAVLLGELMALFGNHTGGIDVGSELPSRLSDATVQPSPFNPTTTVRWATGTPSRNVVRVYDSRGRLVRTLLDEPREPGPQSVAWDGRSDSGALAASGVYLFEVAADGMQVVRKGVLLK